NTPPDPSYPGAHAVISNAGAVVLSTFLGGDRFDFRVTSEVLPGVERSFTRFSAAAQEASSSRVFAGVHFGFDLVADRRLGRQVARFVDGRLLAPVRGMGLGIGQVRAKADTRERTAAQRWTRKHRVASSVVSPSAGS